MTRAIRPAGSVDEVLDLYECFGADNYDESVSQLDHALQCAAHARSAEAEPALVAAALLHDVGHLLDLAGLIDGGSGASGPDGQSVADLHHEQTGSRYLAALFPPAVTAPIALHVRAKRYLCATQPGYAHGLSTGSVESLARQGGSLDDDEVTAFERNPGADAAVRLRHWDDLGKVEGVEVPGLADYRKLLSSFARQ